MGKSWTIASGVFSHDIANFFIGTPGASSIIMRYVANRGFSLPISLTGSVGECSTAPTSAIVIDIQKNQVSIGSMDFAMSANVSTFTFAAGVAFVSGDELELVAPADLFSSSNFGWNLAGIRS